MESVTKEADEKLKKFTTDLMQDIGATVDDAVIKYIATNYDKLVTVGGAYDYSKYDVKLPYQYSHDQVTKFVDGEKIVYSFNYWEHGNTHVIFFTNYARFVKYYFGQVNPTKNSEIALKYWIQPLMIDMFLHWLKNQYQHITIARQHGDPNESYYPEYVVNGFIVPLIEKFANHSREHADEFREKIRGLAVIDAAVQRYQKSPITRALVIETFEAVEKERTELAAARAALAKEREDFEAKKERLRMAAQNLAIQQAELDAKVKIIASIKYESI